MKTPAIFALLNYSKLAGCGPSNPIFPFAFWSISKPVLAHIFDRRSRVFTQDYSNVLIIFLSFHRYFVDWINFNVPSLQFLLLFWERFLKIFHSTWLCCVPNQSSKKRVTSIVNRFYPYVQWKIILHPNRCDFKTQ